MSAGPGYTNFGEPPKAEVPRITLPRTPVNRGGGGARYPPMTDHGVVVGLGPQSGHALVSGSLLMSLGFPEPSAFFVLISVVVPP